MRSARDAVKGERKDGEKECVRWHSMYIIFKFMPLDKGIKIKTHHFKHKAELKENKVSQDLDTETLRQSQVGKQGGQCCTLRDNRLRPCAPEAASTASTCRGDPWGWATCSKQSRTLEGLSPHIRAPRKSDWQNQESNIKPAGSRVGTELNWHYGCDSRIPN